MCRRFAVRVLCLAALIFAACAKDPRVGDKTATPTSSVADTQVTITGAAVDSAVPPHVVVTFRVTQDGLDVPLGTLTTLKPRWTLTGLSNEPVSGLPAWRSYVLTGAPLVKLPIAGPGTPDALILPNDVSQPAPKQPGYETGTITALGDGAFSYTFSSPLADPFAPSGTVFDPTETLRVGLFLSGAPGTPKTSATYDFAKSGPVKSRELVVDADCLQCHASVAAHGGTRQGVKLCLTCHTWQNADPDTVDPAALAGATPASNPNPLELGRFVHRLHRGKNLPTLYSSSSTALAPTLPSATPLPLPFLPGRNSPLPGQKFSVVGYRGSERIYGVAEYRTENFQTPKAVVTGVGFPRDYRSCNACHQHAANAAPALRTEISRRSCGGCHPDVWFGSGPPDAVHLAHPGGVQQADDAACADCHVATSSTPARYVDIADVHVPPYQHPRYDKPVINILAVQDLVPGKSPTVVFKITDRGGDVSPLNTTVPDATSPVPRALSVTFVFSGPTSPDYQSLNFIGAVATPTPANPSIAPGSVSVPGATQVDPATQMFRYTFANIQIPDAKGTWAVAAEARRSATVPHYLTCDTSVTSTCPAGTNVFPWPYTGETVSESADDAIRYVDTGVGSTVVGSTPRRQVVDQDRCNACHERLSLHGDLRHEVQGCVMCHAPDRTDIGRRKKDSTGNVILGQTWDGLEERSVDFKTLIHRIHTGSRTGGSAQLVLSRPHVVYGYGSSVNFLDEAEYPADLANCRSCHLEGTFLLESIPTGAAPTWANETPAIMHAASVAHTSAEQKRLPMTAACMGCHDTGSALLHTAGHTEDGVEKCAQCHSKGALSVKTVHGIP
jgi:OmcA/MtrC family decaheme c-type cytochrome